MDKSDLKGVVNMIFTKGGLPPVKKFGADFADGILFEKLFNLVYDEKIDCKLRPSNVMEDRLLNWSKINCKYFKILNWLMLFRGNLFQLFAIEILSRWANNENLG